MTIRKFMTYDLIVLTMMAIIIDVIGYFASRSALVFFYVSLSIPIMLIAYIRWGHHGLLINVVIASLHIILYRNYEWINLLLYAVSIGSVGLSMIWFKLIKKNQIKDEFMWLTLYYLTGYLSLFLFQILSQYLISGEIQWVTMTARHAINFLLGWLILFIASKQQDFMVDMRHYLLKAATERAKERRMDYDQ